ANLVRRIDQLLHLRALKPRHGECDLRRKTEAAIGAADADFAGHDRLRGVDLLLAGDERDSRIEAIGPAEREELLRVRALARTAEPLRVLHVEIEPALFQRHLAAGAAALRNGSRRVERVSHQSASAPEMISIS